MAGVWRRNCAKAKGGARNGLPLVLVETLISTNY